MEKGKLLYDGKAKQVYATDKDDEIIMHYKDDAKAPDPIRTPKLSGFRFG